MTIQRVSLYTYQPNKPALAYNARLELRERALVAQNLNATQPSVIGPITAAYPVVIEDAGGTLLCDASVLAFTVTLPRAKAVAGMPIGVKKIDGTPNTITVLPSGGDTVDGAATYVLSIPNDVVQLISDGIATWWVI